jgi:Raf kinase inhibitor-like YbhB/YbcL family protein
VVGRTKAFSLITITVVTLLTIAACAGPQEEAEMALSLSSRAFTEGSKIPVQYTCDGQDISPSLAWGEPAPNTKSLALIVDDPDAAGVFTHWVIFNIPANVRQLAENITGEERLQNGALQGRNDFGNIGWGGPCPPRGSHRYVFKIYALDRSLDLKSGASKKQLLGAMEGHILEQGQLIGVYQRK